MKLNSSINQIMESDDRARASYEKFSQASESKNAVIVIAKIPDLFSDKGVQTLYDISESLESLPHLQDIKSLTHSGRPIRKGFSLDFKKMIQIVPFLDTKSKTSEEWQKLKIFLTEYPMTKNILVSDDGKHAIIMAILSESLDSLSDKKKTMSLTRENLKKFEAVEFNFLSEPFVTSEFYDLITTFLLRYTALSLLFSCLIILIIFRSPTILLFMICNQICGLLTFPLIFYWNYSDIGIYTFIIIPLISAIQLTFLTHFYSVFKLHMNSEKSISCLLKKCLEVTFFPSCIAMVSTAIGLTALCFSNITAIKTVGIIGLQSLIAIFILTFLPPFILSRKKESIKEVHTPVESTNSDLTFKWAKTAKAVSLLLITLALTSLPFLKDLEIDIRTKEFLHQDSETRRAIELIDSEIGGVNVFALKVKTDEPGKAQDYDTLKFCHELRQEILKFPEINNAYSYSQMYTVIHQLFLGDNFSIGEVFPPPLQVSLYSQIINSQKIPFQNILQNEDLSETTLFIRTKDIPSQKFLTIVEKVLQKAEEMTLEGVSVEVEGGLQSILSSDRKIVNSQLYSLGISLSFIFIMFLAIWQSVKLALSAILVNIIPLLILFGIMSLTGIPLNSINIMVAPLILGISVDDTIHFIHYLKNLMNKNNDFLNSLRITLKHKFKPILCTSFILTSCMSLFYMAPFPPVQTFGIMAGAILTISLICTLLLLPVLLSMHKKSLFNRQD